MKSRASAALALAVAIAAGCARAPEPLGPAETFHWVAQPVAFAPPPARWERQGDNGGGMLGVRFILTGGGGQSIGVGAYRPQAASEHEPTLAEILPRVRLRPERMQEPGRWRIGYERDTTVAGFPAFASDDTLITPERPLLYHEIFWVVRGCAFKAVYQGTPENLGTFHRVVDSIRFPGGGHVTPS